MTIESIRPIYNFRLISRVLEPRSSARPAPDYVVNDQRQLDLFGNPIVADDDAPSSEPVEAEPDEEPSVANLLEQFFEDKVRRYDYDEDGLLNRAEFAGSDEEFAVLDEDGDGIIKASDLQRQFMLENPEMHEMAEGFASRLYDQILYAPTSDPEELNGMVREFFTDLVQSEDRTGKGSLDSREFPGTLKEFQQIAGENSTSLTADQLFDNFMKNNPDLVELQDSLLQLRQMVLPPTVRPEQVDVYG